MHAAPEQRGRLGALAAALVFLVLMHGAMLFLADGPLAERPLGGADAYSRLTQVTEMERGGWYQDRVPRSNTPYGEPRVWSRAFDAVLWLGAHALTPFLGFRAGLHVWGVVLPPALHILTLLALFWAVRPLLGGEAYLYLGLLYPFQVSVTAEYLAARPDHHPLLGLLFVLVLGATLRLLAGAGRRSALIAGVAMAISLWVSVETLVLAAVVFVTLAVAWLGRRLRAESVATVALSLTMTLVPVLLLERAPATWLAVEYDRVSVAHLVLLALVSGVWLSLSLLERYSVVGTPAAGRMLWLLAGAALVFGLQYLFFAKFFRGPMVDIAPEVRRLNVGRTSEYGPAVDLASLRDTLHLLLLYLGGAAVAAAALPFLLARQREPWRDGWLFVALAGGVYLGLSLYQIRWGLYAELLALPVLAVLLQRLTAIAASWRLVAGMGARASFKFTALLLLATAPIAVGWQLRPAADEADAKSDLRNCDVAALSRFLMQSPRFSGRPQRIMNFVYDGPELLYRTRHQVVATPNHRNGAGLLAAYAFFAAAEPETAHRIAEARSLDLVLLCPSEREGSYYRAAGEKVFWDRLRSGAPPAWLRSIALPAGVGGDFLIYQVVK